MNKQNLILGALFVGVVVVGVIAYTRAEMRQVEHPDTTMNETQEGITIETITEGEGALAVDGKSVAVHYVGTLPSGEKFDSSRDRGEPLSFTLGSGGLIPGFEEGVRGMKVEGVRKVTLAPSQAYGAVSGHPLQNETLIFEIELLSVE